MALTGMAGDLLPLAAPGRASLPQASLWQDGFPYVAFEGDRAVATASTIVHGECLYLALVATVPDARRKGYAQAVVRHSLQRAHETTGLTRTILHATNAGLSVYERLGYRATAQFTLYFPQSPK